MSKGKENYIKYSAQIMGFGAMPGQPLELQVRRCENHQAESVAALTPLEVVGRQVKFAGVTMRLLELTSAGIPVKDSRGRVIHFPWGSIERHDVVTVIEYPSNTGLAPQVSAGSIAGILRKYL